MEWLADNWIWLALGAGVLAFLTLGRGGCGMGHEDHSRSDAGSDAVNRPQQPASQGHRHGCC